MVFIERPPGVGEPRPLPLAGFIARQTGSLALGYIVPLIGFVGVAVYGFYQSTQRTLLSGPAY